MPMDPRNKLNNLSNKEWMISTKSVWFTPATSEAMSEKEWLEIIALVKEKKGEEFVEKYFGQIFPSVAHSIAPPRDALKSEHPATFPEGDIERLIRYFTKESQRVLDPFVGSGSTLVACRNSKRLGFGIDLVPKWAEIAKKRSSISDLPLFEGKTEDEWPQKVEIGDAREVLSHYDDEYFDFIVTSPPYWNILHKDTDHKVKKERKGKGLETRYSDLNLDLGNIASYSEFLEALKDIFLECFRVLKPKKYMAVIVSDFRNKGEFVVFHNDILEIIEQAGFDIQGITILAQENKSLYPYGIPYAFVSNIHHQYILVFQKKRW
ncbi:MAG: DNA methylase [Chloroflexota bacterium]|nr:MAG: DNA methylase [Chloroflexota bacterium]